MMRTMQRRFFNVIAFASAVLVPLVAMAADDSKVYDGRLEGYPRSVTLELGGTALSWMLLVGLGILCLGALFKSAKRSHLD